MTHVIHVEEHGPPEVMKWVEVEVGEPGPGEVRLRQTAIGVNFVDVYFRKGVYKPPGGKLPFVPGQEGAGVVEAVGPGVTGLEARRPRRLRGRDGRLRRESPGAGGAADQASRRRRRPDRRGGLSSKGVTAQCLLTPRLPGQEGPDHPLPCRRRRCRLDRLPMGFGARRQGHRHGRVG